MLHGMKIRSLKLDGLKELFPLSFDDERGCFLETYQETRYHEIGLNVRFVQDNVSYSSQFVLRGLHFQESPGQAKLVTCLQGEVWDVALDIRKDSNTFGQWEAVYLNESLHNQLFIPVGFAHGFCVLSEKAVVQYKVSSIYDPSTEKTIQWNDPELKIDWPVQNPILSPRDQNGYNWKTLYENLGCR